MCYAMKIDAFVKECVGLSYLFIAHPSFLAWQVGVNSSEGFNSRQVIRLVVVWEELRFRNSKSIERYELWWKWQLRFRIL